MLLHVFNSQGFRKKLLFFVCAQIFLTFNCVVSGDYDTRAWPEFSITIYIVERELACFTTHSTN